MRKQLFMIIIELFPFFYIQILDQFTEFYFLELFGIVFGLFFGDFVLEVESHDRCLDAIG